MTRHSLFVKPFFSPTESDSALRLQWRSNSGRQQPNAFIHNDLAGGLYLRDLAQPRSEDAPGPDFRTWDTTQNERGESICPPLVASSPTHSSITTWLVAGCPIHSAFCAEWVGNHEPTPRSPGAPGPDFRTWDTTNLQCFCHPERP